jgi:probable phosphoglycerate mutase
VTARAIILLRHGQTDYNKDLRMQGQIDIPLNDLGREQATRAAEVLARAGVSRVVASDLSRATETGRILAEAAGVDLEIDGRLKERGFGSWEGFTRDELEESHPEEYEVWRGGGDPAGIGVESRADAGRRVAEAILEVGQAAADGEVVAIASHGAAITLGISEVLGLGPQWFGAGAERGPGAGLAPRRAQRRRGPRAEDPADRVREAGGRCHGRRAAGDRGVRSHDPLQPGGRPRELEQEDVIHL